MPHESLEDDRELALFWRTSSTACSSAGEYEGLWLAYQSANPIAPMSTAAATAIISALTHVLGSRFLSILISLGSALERPKSMPTACSQFSFLKGKRQRLERRPRRAHRDRLNSEDLNERMCVLAASAAACVSWLAKAVTIARCSAITSST